MMATFFGEIVHHTSRAFLDGCEYFDEEVNDDKRPVFQLNTIANVPDELDLTVFSTDKVCSDFASVCFQPDTAKIVATISELKQTKDGVEAEKQQKIVAEVYKITSKILLFMCTSDIDMLQANELLNLVVQWINKSKEVIVLATNHIGAYKSFDCDKPFQSSFVRSLKSETFKESNVLCPFLEGPNALSGFSAAVLIWCQVQDKPCVLYVYYYITSFPVSDKIDVEPFYTLLQKLPWYKQFKKDNQKIGDNIKDIKIRNHVFENSNLYL